jgi:hypothetical protein
VGSRPQHAELLPNGHLLFLGNLGESEDMTLMEFSWDGEIVWEYQKLTLHHDFARLPNGNTLVLGLEVVPPEISAKVIGGIPGTERDGNMWSDIFAEITMEGDLVWEWRLFEHLNPEEDVICPLCSRSEWTHHCGNNRP